MRKFFVFVGTCLLSAGISYAQSPAEVLFRAAKSARYCSYKPEKISLDKNGNEKGEWKVSDDDSSVLKELTSGNKNYLRALNALREERRLLSESGDSMEFEAAIPEEIPYGPFGLIFKLYDLHVVLKQNMQDREWLPTSFEIIIKYRFLGFLTYEKQRGNIDCSVLARATP